MFDGPDQACHTDGEDVGFDFCFTIGVEIPHAKKWCEDVADPVGVVVEVFDTGGCPGGVFFLEPFVAFEIDHEKAVADEGNPLNDGEARR